jgi:uncharacterized protein DUF669
MKAAWDDIPDADDFSPIPDGEYLMKVAEAEEKQSKNGNPMWKLVLEIVNGQFKGRRVWDNITWSGEGMKRVKLVLSRLGLDLKGDMEVATTDIVGRSAWVTVTQESFWSEKHEKEMKTNKPTFAGYRRAEGGAATEPAAKAEADVPF